MTARANTRRRREKMRRRTVIERPPFQRQITHTICAGIYPEGCACAKALDRPACEGIDRLAQQVIDMVRDHDRMKSESFA